MTEISEVLPEINAELTRLGCSGQAQPTAEGTGVEVLWHHEVSPTAPSGPEPDTEQPYTTPVPHPTAALGQLRRLSAPLEDLGDLARALRAEPSPLRQAAENLERNGLRWLLVVADPRTGALSLQPDYGPAERAVLPPLSPGEPRKTHAVALLEVLQALGRSGLAEWLVGALA